MAVARIKNLKYGRPKLAKDEVKTRARERKQKSRKIQIQKNKRVSLRRVTRGERQKILKDKNVFKKIEL